MEKYKYNTTEDYPGMDVEQSFEQIIIEFLDKMRVFEQLIRDMNLKYERIRLIIFYDVVIIIDVYLLHWLN